MTCVSLILRVLAGLAASSGGCLMGKALGRASGGCRSVPAAKGRRGRDALHAVSGSRSRDNAQCLARSLAGRDPARRPPPAAGQALPASADPALVQNAGPPENAVQIIEARAVAMTAYACRMCGRRISVAADDPIADPRCPQCGGPMDAAPET